MLAYVIQRILATIPVMFLVAVFVFLLLHLSPGDPAAILAGDNASEANLQRIRETLGLDRPLWVQFHDWILNVLRGDLGRSLFSGHPVTHLIAQRLEPTLVLAATSMSVAILFAIPMGVIAAWKAGTWIDRAIMGFAVLGFSLPIFVLGYGLIWTGSIWAGWFPVQGYRSPFTDGLLPFIRHITLPSLALGMVYMALLARMTRATMLEVLNEDYIRTAHAKGLLINRILLLHALKNAAVPIITVIGIGIGLLIGGVVITETVFNIPGLGRLTVDAVLRNDYPVIQGVILLFSFIFVMLNLLVDLAYVLFDPRVAYSK